MTVPATSRGILATPDSIRRCGTAGWPLPGKAGNRGGVTAVAGVRRGGAAIGNRCRMRGRYPARATVRMATVQMLSEGRCRRLPQGRAMA